MAWEGRSGALFPVVLQGSKEAAELLGRRVTGRREVPEA